MLKKEAGLYSHNIISKEKERAVALMARLDDSGKHRLLKFYFFYHMATPTTATTSFLVSQQEELCYFLID